MTSARDKAVMALRRWERVASEDLLDALRACWLEDMRANLECPEALRDVPITMAEREIILKRADKAEARVKELEALLAQAQSDADLTWPAEQDLLGRNFALDAELGAAKKRIAELESQILPPRAHPGANGIPTANDWADELARGFVYSHAAEMQLAPLNAAEKMAEALRAAERRGEVKGLREAAVKIVEGGSFDAQRWCNAEADRLDRDGKGL